MSCIDIARVPYYGPMLLFSRYTLLSRLCIQFDPLTVDMPHHDTTFYNGRTPITLVTVTVSFMANNYCDVLEACFHSFFHQPFAGLQGSYYTAN